MSALKTTWAACIVAFAAVILAGPRTVLLSNDSVEYISTFHHMADGDGFISDLKLYLCTPGPVRHSAMGERQPAYPAALAVGRRLLADSSLGHLATHVLGGLAAAAIVALAAGLFGMEAAWICVPIAVLAPALVDADTLVGPTGMYIVWLASFVLATARAVKDLRWSLAVGLLWALMALTRGEGMLVGVAGLIWMAANRGESSEDTARRGINPRPTASNYLAAVVSLGVFIVAMIPYFAFNAHVNGSPFVSLASMHVKVRTFSECMWYGYGRKLPSTVQFLSENLKYAVGLSVRNFFVYALNLLRLSWLGAGLAILAYAVATARKDWPQEGLILPVVGAMQCFAIAMMWSTTSGRPEPEHLAPPLLALAIPAVGWAIWRASRERLWPAVALVAIVVATYTAVYATRKGEPSTVWTDVRHFLPAIEAAKPSLAPGVVVASDRPWPVWFAMRRPTVILPRGLSPDEEVRFLREYQVQAILAWPSDAAAWQAVPGVRTILAGVPESAMALSVDQAALPRSP